MRNASVFKGKTFVLKLSGKALADSSLLASVCTDLVCLQRAGVKTVVVHGGGRQIDLEAERLGLPKKVVNGLRYTDEKVLAVVERVLSQLNAGIVSCLESRGGKAVGLNVGKRFVVKARKRGELGFVGAVSSVDSKALRHWFSLDVVPVISCLARGRSACLNVNADDVAVEVALAVNADRLVFVSDVPGILGRKENASSLIPVVSVRDLKGMVKEGLVSGGMVPKALACVKAANAHLALIQVIGSENHSILDSLLAPSAGTKVVK